jgi:ATP-dependent DNA helicase RecG
MGVPSNDEVLALLNRLEDTVADDLETLWLEFKPWDGPKDSMRVATEYAVCMANSEGGVIVFGVKDKVKGRSNAIHGAAGYDIDVWRRGVFDSTRPNLPVEVEELPVPDGTGRLLVVRVPKGPSPPYGTAEGLFKKRVGKSCMPMDAQSFVRAQISTGALDWSGQPAEGVVLDDLDPVEIARARNILRRLASTSDLLSLDDAAFLTGLGALRAGAVTNAGLLLFGQETVLSDICPQYQVHYVHQVSETEVARNEPYRYGLLNILERIEQVFTGPLNPEQELSIGFFKLRIPAFPLEVVREALLNAVTHRDYSNPADVLFRHTSQELVVTSPGGFLAGITPQNILRAEPVTRNRTLAEAFQKLRLVERAGVGRRRIFLPMLSCGKRIPVYETDGTRVILRVFNGGFDERMARLVAKWRGEGREIDLDELLILSFLRQNAFLDSTSASELLQLPREEARAVLDRLSQPRTGILERRGKTKAASYHLTKGVSNDLLGKAAYTRAKGLDRTRHPEMVKAFLRDHGSITPKECRELLGLGESPSARVEVSRYLARWAEEGGFLRRDGKTRRVRYYLRQDS